MPLIPGHIEELLFIFSHAHIPPHISKYRNNPCKNVLYYPMRKSYSPTPPPPKKKISRTPR